MKTNRHAAFTLMELMISVALALVLILGINEVFGLTAKTVGAGQALSTSYQSDRAAQLVMANDFKNMVNTAPLIITSQSMAAFRSTQDQQTDVDGKPATVDPLGATAVTIPADVLHYRMHRLDSIAFCARDLYQRQTGGVSGAFLTPSSSYEAYIWYGHLNIGNNSMPTSGAWSTSTNPGVGTPPVGVIGPPTANPNNYYASQWVLGRMAMLFQQSTIPVVMVNGVPTPTPPALAYVNGLEYNSTSTNITGYTVQMSRLDVVSGTAGATTNEGTIDAFTANIYTKSPTAWWGGTTSSNMTSPAWLNYRFQCDPKPPRPLTPDTAAFYSPAFVPSCSQFCVEFAGDFVNQSGGGTAGPDGTIDYNMVNGTRQIRWYGMPRNVSTGDTTINVTRGDVNTVAKAPEGVPTGTAAYTFEKMAAGSSTYIAAWHPKETNNPRPKLIRITWAVDDANNRLGSPVTFECVFPVP